MDNSAHPSQRLSKPVAPQSKKILRYLGMEGGFTLIEILVAVGIVSVLGAGVFVTLVKQPDKARDVQRLSSIGQIKNALDVYYQDKNCYPTNASFLDGTDWKDTTTGTVYMNRMPKDPVTGAAYKYVADSASCPQWGIVYAPLSSAQSTNTCKLPSYVLDGSGCVPSGSGLNSTTASSWGCEGLGNITCNIPDMTPTPTLNPALATPTPTGTPTPAPTIAPTQLVQDADHDRYYIGGGGPQVTTGFQDNANGKRYYKSSASEITNPANPYIYIAFADTLGGNDCNDNAAAVYRNMNAYSDADGDSYTGTARFVCMGASYPAGYTAAPTDCNDANATVFQNVSVVRDTDRDAYYTGSATTQCVGNPTLYWVGSNQIGFWGLDNQGGPYSTDVSYFYGHGDVNKRNDAFLTGVSFQGTTYYGQVAAYFNGTTGYAQTVYDTDVLRTGPYSVSLWLYAPQQNEYWKGLFGKPGRDYNMWLGNANGTAGFIHHRFHSTSSWNDGCTDSANLVTWNTWHHIVITNNGTNCQTYIDGIGLPAPGTVNGSLVADPGLVLMAKNLDGNPGNYLAGYLDEVQIYDRALSPTEINTLRDHNLVYKGYYKTISDTTDTLLATTDAIGGSDCGDNNVAGWKTRTFYVDSDGDGYGAGAGVSLCAGSFTPTGYSTNNTDCLDSNAYVYQNVNPLVWWDDDQDLYYTGAGSGNACVGPYIVVNTPNGAAAYYRSITGAYNVTTGAYGIDCNPNDRNTYQNLTYYIDSDGDGYKGTPALVCSGATLPAGYQATSNDCNESSANVFQTLPVIQDSDQDGYYYFNQTVTNQCVGALSRPWVGSNLIGWWQLDDGVSGGITSDISYYYGHTGNHVDGYVSGTTQLATGGRWGDPAKSFNGNGDIIGMPTYYTQLDRSTGPLSVFTNIKSNNANAFQVIFGQADYGQGGQFNINLSRYGDGRIEVNAGGVLLANNLSNTVLASNTWYNVGFVRTGYSGNWTYKIYINGVLDKTFTTTVDPGIQRYTVLGGLVTYPQYSFNGVLDEIQMYSRALSDREVSWVYSNDLVYKDYYRDVNGNYTWLIGTDAIGPDAYDADWSIY